MRTTSFAINETLSCATASTNCRGDEIGTRWKHFFSSSSPQRNVKERKVRFAMNTEACASLRWSIVQTKITVADGGPEGKYALNSNITFSVRQHFTNLRQNNIKYVPLSPLREMPHPKQTHKNNAGVVVKAKNAPQGEIYAKWKRSSNRKVGREGDEEEARGAGNGASSAGGGGWGSGGGRGRRGGWGDTAGGGGGGGGEAWGAQEAGAGRAEGAGRGAKEKGGRVVKDELKTKGQIRKAKQKVRSKHASVAICFVCVCLPGTYIYFSVVFIWFG